MTPIPVIMLTTWSYPSKCSGPFPHMCAPTVSSTTFGARWRAALTVAEASPVRSAFRYASTALVRESIGLWDPRRKTFGRHILLLCHLADDERERPAFVAARQVLH